MYELDGKPLPFVTVKNVDDWAKYVKDTKMPPEQIAEFMVLIKREKEKVSALAELEKALRDKAMAYYETVTLDKRESIKTDAALLAYSPPSETVALRDRDETVAELTDEQIRISYKPDLNALKTILLPEVLERLTVRKAKAHSITLRDNKGELGEF